LSYTGPFHNIHPDVRYVGDGQCAACHEDKEQTFRRHPMGRSLVPIAQLAPRQPYDARHNNPFTAMHSRFRVEHKGDRIWHLRALLDGAGEPIIEYGPEVHYAIGSGTRGYSYVTDQDGYLFQTSISWYSQKQTWDLSPGFETQQVTQRPITSECLFCHANRAHPSPQYENRYEKPIFSGQAIGCERCHGPGERHVGSGDPFDIVNPSRKRLTDPRLRDAVCAQCHLHGLERVLRQGRDLYDFRPGLPLEEFWSVFVRPREGDRDTKAVSHFEQMHLSRCFRESSGDDKLGCISCHDPHVKPTAQQRIAYFKQRCLACHEDRGCALPRTARLQKSKEDSCIDCHMPRYGATDVVHTAATDHRIPRREELSEGKVMGPPTQGGSLPLVPFGRERLGPKEGGYARDLGVALVSASSHGQLPPQRAGTQAIILLGSALEKHPEDLEGWIARGWALMLTGDRKGGLAAFDEVLTQVPQHERAFVGAATLAEDLQQIDRAIAYWSKAVAMNPWMPSYRRRLTLLYSRQRLSGEERRECRAWLRLEPDSIEARMLWIGCLIREGKKADARAEFARIEAMQPQDLETWRKHYQQMTASTP
jgi:tetratricopeptide (TPR) repeat protein